MLPRLTLFEFLDQAWLPRWIRLETVKFLGFLWRIGRTPEAMAPALRTLLEKAGEATIVDLCSGSGSLTAQTVNAASCLSGKEYQVILTDLFPPHPLPDNLPSFARYNPEPTNAINALATTPGVRTIFTALHHLPPDAVQALLGEAIEHRTPILVVEPTARRFLLMFGVIVFNPILYVLYCLERIPKEPHRALLALLFPLPLLCACFDGVVSCWRTYTEAEIRKLIEPWSGKGYNFTFSTTYSGMGWPLGVIAGSPQDRDMYAK